MNYVEIAAFSLISVALGIQLYFLLGINLRFSKYKIIEKQDEDQSLAVSVIICARNEEKNLEKNLPLILEQKHPNFEVVVVNDCSGDDSHMILRGFSSLYPQLKVVTINEHDRFKHGKKFAVSLGVKAAKNEFLLFTDADCEPVSDLWIQTMQRNFYETSKSTLSNSSKDQLEAGLSINKSDHHIKEVSEIVLGYSPYKREPGFLNRLIRYETFNTALNYFSYALAGFPYMGVGRNMAYTKSLFFKGKGFASHMHIPSGDDDLFVNQNATRSNVAIEIHPNSIVWTEPKRSFTSYFSQKVRHMGAGKAYKPLHKKMLSIQTASALVFYLVLGVLAFVSPIWWLIVGFYLFRLLVQVLVFNPVLKKLQCNDLIWWIPLLDFIFNFYILVLGIVSLFKKKVKWK